MKTAGLWNAMRYATRTIGLRGESTVATAVEGQSPHQISNIELLSRIASLEGGRDSQTQNMTLFGMVLTGLFGGAGFVYKELKRDIDGIRKDVKEEIDGIRKDVKGEIDGVKREINDGRKDVAEVRREMHEGFRSVEKTMFELFKQKQESERTNVGLAAAINSQPSKAPKL